eukprot:jgi/Psemu1/288426/fgenesh1_pg.260_\
MVRVRNLTSLVVPMLYLGLRLPVVARSSSYGPFGSMRLSPRRWNATHNNNGNETTLDQRTAGSATTMRDSYKYHSFNQYSAHIGCQDLLEDCARRLMENRRLETEKVPSTMKIADLGSADGSNSVRTVGVFLDALQDNAGGNINCNCDGKLNVHLVFEEQSSSDEEKLRQTVSSWSEDITQNSGSSNGMIPLTIKHDVLMKSFYECLFEPESIDFCMSYICLHWLDTSDTPDIRQWKRMVNGGDVNQDKSNQKNLDQFVHVNERTTPSEVRQWWKKNLADRHLAKFLALRAKELRPGRELMVVMVADPNGFWKPPSPETESPLLRAMKRCIQEGSVRKEVLEQTIIPYYLRHPRDVRDALALAKKQDSDANRLRIIKLRHYETLIGDHDIEQNKSGMKAAKDLFWAIHGGSVIHTSGATPSEVHSIRIKLADAFEEFYDPDTGVVKIHFIACVFRKEEQ